MTTAKLAIIPYISQESLRASYFSYFHSMLSYGIIFGVKSISNNIFRLQKRVIRIITDIRIGDFCREQFKKLQILPRQSQHILPLLLFVINSRNMFEHKCEIHTNPLKNKTNLHLPHLRLSAIQKGVFYPDIKVYNDLPSNIQRLIHDKIKFKTTLKNFLLTHSYCSLDLGFYDYLLSM
jgi:hypothetical protein